MLLAKIVNKLDGFANKLSTALHYVSSTVLALMMFITAVDVVGRYFFSKPVKGSFELNAYMLVIVVSFALAYCGAKKGHIHVDVLMMYMPERAKDIINCCTNLICIFLMLWTTWYSLIYASVLKASNQNSTVLMIPIYPFVIALIIGFGVYTITIIKDFLDSLYRVVKR